MELFLEPHPGLVVIARYSGPRLEIGDQVALEHECGHTYLVLILGIVSARIGLYRIRFVSRLATGEGGTE